MQSPTLPHPPGLVRAIAPPARVTLSLRGLLAIYAIIPVCALVYAIDRLALGSAIRDALPRNPDHLFVYGLLFGWPHIVASNVILFGNAEYRRAYRARVLVASAIIVAFFGAGTVFLPYEVLAVVAATITIIHVLKQQIGIGAGAARLSGRLYPIWGWTGIATGVVLYNALYLDGDLARYAGTLDATAYALAALVLLLAIACDRRITTALGRAFLWGNTAMILVPVGMHATGYDIFALAIPRIIHDTTAFAFYVAHDRNRHGAAPGNPLYRVAARIPGGVYWLAPLLAVTIAYLLERHGDRVFHLATGGVLTASYPEIISLGVLGYLAMLHYYTEAFTWKTGSPYRRYIGMRP
ncbi:MAG: hypothetical protein K8W52_27200 [Deltaproteobacteria bacterium]|nr:hypothetical protein [Deltaproteobacteria bacterium]